MPAETGGNKETIDGSLLLHSPDKATKFFWVIEFEREEPEVLATFDGKKAFTEMGVANSVVENSCHSVVHRTDSVDYIVMLQSEIHLLLDESEVHLFSGDTAWN